MTGFSADWLSLREPHDARARNACVFGSVIAWCQARSPIRIVDLGCGTGAMRRALAPHLGADQSWRLFDNDRDLLARAARPSPPRGLIEAVPLDLSRDLARALDAPIDLVTCAALLDLVSEDWLDRFAHAIAARAIPVYATLSYDGRVELSPADALDVAILVAVNADQRRDKSFGPALGPGASAVAPARLASLGYSVTVGRADWILRPKDRDIQVQLLSCWAAAACQAGVPRERAANWLRRRHALVATGRSTVRVGHIDFWAYQTGRRAADRSKSNKTSSSRR